VGSVDECFCQIDLAAIAEILRQPSQQPFENALAYPLLIPTVARLVRRVPRRQIHPRRARTHQPKQSIHDVAWIAIGPSSNTLLDRLFFREKRPYEGPLLVGEVHIKVRSETDPPVDPLLKSDRVSRT